MKFTNRHVVRGLFTTAVVFAVLAALLTSCGGGHHHDDCDAFTLSAAEVAPARPHPQPAAHPRAAAHPAPARRPSLRKAPAPHPAVTVHVIHHVVVHTPARRKTKRAPVHHTVIHHYDDDLCD